MHEGKTLEFFHKTVFRKGCLQPGVETTWDAIAYHGCSDGDGHLPQDTLYQIVSAIFSSQGGAVCGVEGRNQVTPERAVRQVTPDSLKYLHPGAQKFFKERGVLA